ncbi:hypothetical protein HYALB_00009374 [Hymenoscyphus albidus]|uniref:Uncharacterized protein n=1 Tax=Hymenoscyphus albidus TaxID=595503 RepID=A0A9N9LD18_9HELO|nr:hypothetical protein HYALB_00009374 [Hymenoscyphus albidus]
MKHSKTQPSTSCWSSLLNCFSTRPSPPGSPVLPPRRPSETSVKSLKALSIPLPPLPSPSISVFRRRVSTMPPKPPSSSPSPSNTTTLRTLLQKPSAPTKQELLTILNFPSPDAQLDTLLNDPLITAYFRKLRRRLGECGGIGTGSRVAKVERSGRGFVLATGRGSDSSSLPASSPNSEARGGAGRDGKSEPEPSPSSETRNEDENKPIPKASKLNLQLDLSKETAEKVIGNAVQILQQQTPWAFKDEVALEADEPRKGREGEYFTWWVVVFVEGGFFKGVGSDGGLGGGKEGVGGGGMEGVGGKGKDDLEGLCWIAWGFLDDFDGWDERERGGKVKRRSLIICGMVEIHARYPGLNFFNYGIM